MKVLKFGGSSVGSADKIKQVLSIIKNYNETDEQIAVVSSALQGVTDELLLLGEKAVKRNDSYSDQLNELRLKHILIIESLISSENTARVIEYTENLFDQLKGILQGVYLLKELTPRILDNILSFGERLSCYIIAATLKVNNENCRFLNSAEIIKTDESFGHAKVDFAITNDLIKKYFNYNTGITVVTGFIGSSKENEITTLGRGGSDYTASILGTALDLEEIEIWTDVDGIMTADPRRVIDALSLSALTYAEAMEMSYFGAKVIYPPTIQPALDNKIKVRIKNTFNPTFKGTVILEKQPGISFNAKGISSVDNITLLRIEGAGLFGNEDISSRIFYALAKQKIKVLLLTQGSSGISICIAVQPQFGQSAKNAISEELRLELLDGEIREISAEENLSIIAVVGEDMRQTTGISGKVFQSLGKNGINIIAIAQGSSELNISFVIKNDELTKALNVLHDSLFLSERKILNLFLVGPGLVGSALLRYIKDRKQYSEKELHTSFKLIGLTNSRKMVFNTNGISFDNWQTELGNSKIDADIIKFIRKMKILNLSNTIFLDCTASNIAVPFYESILNSSISIASPNKIANTGKYDDYKRLCKSAMQHNVQFRYGTNVGAALPIINTLKDLIVCGEEIFSIEGILSGTLSYLFNSFTGTKKFSEIIREAKEKGFTQPDPREDLNGLDVARKLLILARESGAKLELSDIEVENLVPESARGDMDLSSFYDLLENEDEMFEQKLKNSADRGTVLRYIAKYDKDSATVGLKEVNSDHPFFSLKGNNNIVSIKTTNYFDHPLVISGKGAGADFTASGIYADILRISNYLS